MPTSDSVRSYLQEIGRIPMLTPAEELTLGKQVQEMMSHEEDRRDYNAKRDDPLTVEQFTDQFRAGREREVKRAYRLGTRAKNRMVSANLRLVVSIAKKYSKRNLELLDIIQEGTLGLVRGVEKFDPTRGYKFSTYAYWWVRQGITRAIGEKSRMVRLPVNVVDTLNQVRKTQQKLSQELMRTATLQEVCEELDLSHEAVRDLMHRSQEPCSLEVRIGDAQDSRLVEMLVDDSEDPEQLLAVNTMGEDLHEAFADLTNQEQSVLCLHYGFVAGEQDDPRSMSWISNKLNLSRDRVRLIEKRALVKLKGADLKGYLENVS